VAYRSGSFFVGLGLLVLSACSASSDDATGPKPPITECTKVSDCPTGTAACVDGFCAAQGCVDKDKDGAGVGPGCTIYDCNDNDPTVPSGSEVCGNGKDDNCNGVVDEGCPCTDASGNTLPEGSTRDCGTGPCKGTQTCTGGTWGSTCAGGATPAAQEICNNGIDDNCDGQQDEGCCAGTEKPCPGTAVCSSNGICK
jgi:hypothetical protein